MIKGMKLEELTLEQCEQVRIWRNDCMESLRTPYMLTAEQQAAFYRDTVCNRDARSRWWAVMIPEGSKTKNTKITDMPLGYDIEYISGFVGMVGLENIEWENGCAEISIMFAPWARGLGLGEQALHLLLEQGFLYMRLDEIWGECYVCNPALKFWHRMVDKYHAKTAILPRRKYWNGSKFDSFYFSISKEVYMKCHG